MTVSTTTNKQSYTGNGVATLFGFPIPFIAATDLLIYVAGVLQTLTTDYTISGSAPYPTGANVTFTTAPALAAAILIVRTRPYTQTLDLVPNDPLPADTVELLLGDHLMMCIQQIKEITDRSFTLPITDTSGASLAIPSPVASTFLGWNAAGTALENYPGVSTVPVSGAMAAVVAASTLALARAAMGVPGLTDNNTFSGTNAFLTSTTGTNSTQVATTAFAQSTARAYGSGHVNKFRNAMMDIAQRGLTGTITTGTSGYTLDGWIIGATGATATWLQTGGSDWGTYKANNVMKITGNTSMTDTFIKQRIEASTAAILAGQTVTFQCSFANNSGASITPTITVKHAGSQDNWSSPVTDVNAVALQSFANSTQGSLAYTFTAHSDTQFGLEVMLDFGASLNANTKNVILTGFDIRATPGVAIGLNSNPPFPELRSFATEQVLCNRFFRSSFPVGVTPAQNAGITGAFEFPQTKAASTGSIAPKILFDVPMFAAPTTTLYNPAAANAQLRNETGGTDYSASGVTHSYANGLLVTGTTPGGSAIGDVCAVHYTCTAEL